MSLYKKIIAYAILLVPFWATSQTHLTFNNTEYFINGINIPWNSFGTDVGTHYQWGALYDPDWFEIFFSECEDYGVNTARLWLHADGRSTPEFDINGYVTGLDDNFFENLDDIFERAENHNVMLILCLWSFDMMKDRTASAGKFAGVHGDLVRDSTKTNSYIENALIPIVNRYAEQCNLLAYEIINEPEWAIDITQGAGTTETSTLKEMQRFVGMQATAIHAFSDKMVTVGSAGLMFNSTTPPAATNFWADSMLLAANGGNESCLLDFYQIHFWDWMSDLFDPFLVDFDYWNLDKPTIIGECPSNNDGSHSVDFMVNKTYENNWSGILPWSYWGMDGAGNWEEAKEPLLALRNEHPEAIDFSCIPTFFENPKPAKVSFQVFPNPTKGRLTINRISSNEAQHIQITNSSGTILFASKIQTSIDISHLPVGMFFLQFFNLDGALIHTEKMIKS